LKHGYHSLGVLGKTMKGQTRALPFRKSESCPSSSILLSFRLDRLSPVITNLVRYHLGVCEFCNAELPLLSHYKRGKKRLEKVPEIPMNLRILAEAILSSRRKSVS